ncbi:MAG: YcxB family protein [Oscillospiraceae bacterium]|jgi:hypothetical protein|nr:YcxB family protein [Oscillospiraceae bacterium]
MEGNKLFESKTLVSKKMFWTVNTLYLKEVKTWTGIFVHCLLISELVVYVTKAEILCIIKVFLLFFFIISSFQFLPISSSWKKQESFLKNEFIVSVYEDGINLVTSSFTSFIKFDFFTYGKEIQDCFFLFIGPTGSHFIPISKDSFTAGMQEKFNQFIRSKIKF